MLRNLIIGQYVYKNSFIHKLDPRIKILSVVLISIGLFLIKSYFGFAIATIFIAVIALISKIKIKNVLKNLRPFLLFFAFILVMYSFFSKDELATGFIVVWRFILLIITASILTFSTTISDLVLALEKLFRPLKIIGVKSRDIAVMVAITLRFIPLFFLEATKIRDAKLSRLADLKKFKHIKLVVIPLLEKVFKRASNLSDAIESRCYKSEGTTNMRELRLGFRDFLAFGVMLILTGVLAWM